jgi:hypothetical protein
VGPALAAIGDLGSLPSPDLGAHVAARFGLSRAPRSSWEIGAAFFVPVTVRVADGEVQFEIVRLDAALCPVGLALGRRVEISPCLGGALSFMSTTSSGFARNASSSGSWLSATAGLRGRLAFGQRVGMFGDASAIVSTSRRAWQLSGYGDVFDAGLWAGVLAIGVDARW